MFNQYHLKPYPHLPLDSKTAELVGIILGDGCINSITNQLSITLNRKRDSLYINYVVKLLNQVFYSKPLIYQKKDSQATVVYLNGVQLIKRLKEIGLKPGNKTKFQVSVPNWINDNLKFSKLCVRGLIDTDGGIFLHSYIINRKRYSYYKLNFVNRSLPLVQFVFNTLKKHHLSPKYAQNYKHVWLYSTKEVVRYLRIIGSSNPRVSNAIKPNLI